MVAALVVAGRLLIESLQEQHSSLFYPSPSPFLRVEQAALVVPPLAAAIMALMALPLLDQPLSPV